MGVFAITGAGGFIGHHIAWRLAQRGHDLILIDSPPRPGCPKNPLPADPVWQGLGATFLEVFANPPWKLDGLIHLGATISTEEIGWDQMIANNFEFSRRLWELCAQNQIPLIFASTGATYGDGALGFDESLHPGKLRPQNRYAQSKNLFDLFAMEARDQGVPEPPRWAGFKFFNVYGPGESHKRRLASMVWQGFQQIRATGRMTLFSSPDPGVPDGHQERDFVFVGDCVDQMVWWLNHPVPSGLFNGGTGQPRTFWDLAHILFRTLRLPPAIDFVAMPEELKSSFPRRTCGDPQKLKAAGYTATPTPLESGVPQAVQGYLRETQTE